MMRLVYYVDMKNIFVHLLVVLLLACKQKPIYDMGILDVNRINIESGEIDNVDIYINQDRIVSIQSADSKDFPSEEIINARGAFAIPGLWDNHIHFRGGESLRKDNEIFLEQLINHGITSVRDAGGDLTPNIKKWQLEILENKRVGPTIFTSGPKIDGKNSTWQGSLEVESEIELDQALDSLEKLEVDFIKLYDSKLSGNLFLSALKKSTKRGLKSSGHMPFDVTLNQAIDAGMNGVEHLYYILKGSSNKESEITNQFQNDAISFWEAMPLLINTYDESTAKGLFDRLNHKEIFVVPTLYIGHTLSYLDEFDHSDDEYLNILSPAFKMTYERRVKNALNSSPETRAQRKKLDEFFRKLTLKIHEAGVELMAGSDAGAYNSYIYPGPSLHKELESLVAVGLSPLEALKTSIVNGPKWLGVEDDYGVIANGKKADILLLKKNPLIDIKNTISIQAVIRNGHLMNKNIEE
jgi:hypothetical protein